MRTTCPDCSARPPGPNVEAAFAMAAGGSLIGSVVGDGWGAVIGAVAGFLFGLFSGEG